MNPFDSRWPASTLTLMVRIEANEASGRDFADWGADAVKAGHDSPALRRLAGLAAGRTPSRLSAEPEFRAAAQEVGLPDVKRDDLLLAFMDECASTIAGGAPNIDAMLHTIHEQIIEPLDHPEALIPWCEARGRLRSGSEGELTVDDIRALARKWLEGRTPTVP